MLDDKVISVIFIKLAFWRLLMVWKNIYFQVTPAFAISFRFCQRAYEKNKPKI